MTMPSPPLTRAWRALPLALALWLTAATAAAQTMDSTDDAFAATQAGDLPSYVVPVLRLVSSTHVEPTTGLVLSDSGLVLVPGGFASAGDEVVVLDGGTDIVSNGRTARIERDLPMDGLQVLSVYGLRRAPAPFADDGLADGDSVSLRAFPPAEQIAEGAAPLDVPATVTVFGESGNPAISGDTALPNVTGPLLDECGNVAAFSIANDIQTMASSPGTRYRWRATLLDVMARLGLRPAPSACVDEVLAEDVTEPETIEPDVAESGQPPEEAAPATDPESEPPAGEPVVEDEAAAEEPPAPEEPLDLEVLPPIESEVIAEQTPAPVIEQDQPRSYWAWLLLAAALVAAGLALQLWRRRLAAADEPVEDAAVQMPFSPEHGVDKEPEAADSLLRATGRFADGRPIGLSCPVNRDAINVVIGRGRVDLRIESAAVSRRHASLNGSSEELTLTDLGSSNGTMLNGVPCMEGEIFYCEAGDTLVLGDARFTLELEPIAEADER